MTLTYCMTAAVLFICLLFMLVDARRKLQSSSLLRVSTVLIGTTMFYVAMDCLWIVEYTLPDAQYDQGIFSLLNVLFYLVYITLPYIWFLFAQHFVRNLASNRKLMLACAAPWAFNFVLVLVTVCGADALWSIGDAANRYTRGPLFNIFTSLNQVYYFIPVIEIIALLVYGIGKGAPTADRRILLNTLGFSIIPALGVFIYTNWIPVEAIYPFQPCCFFIGVICAYILLITQAYDRAEEEKIRLAEEAAANAKIAELTESVTSLLTNMPALTFSKDVSNGRYLACNQLFAEYAHKETPEGVVGLTDHEIFDPITAQHFVDDDEKALSMDEPYVFYEDVPDAAGNPRQFQTTKIKFTDTAGRLCTLGMCVDVSEVAKMRQETINAKREYEEARNASMTYSHIARALSADYRSLYYVDVQTSHYIEYDCDATHEELTEKRRGDDFFEAGQMKALRTVYEEDQDLFFKLFTRENILGKVAERGTYAIAYRLVEDGVPVHMNLKATLLEGDRRHIIVGITNIDTQMKQREAAERVKEERITYGRITALSGDFICIYTVDPETGQFVEYAAQPEYENLGLQKTGDDFFEQVRLAAPHTVYHEDVDKLLTLLTRENIMSVVERGDVYVLEYRLMMDGAPLYVSAKAALVEEKDKPQLLVGISNIDARVRQEREYEYNLAAARNKANLDSLTGVKNKHAYVDIEAQLNHSIEEHQDVEFAIAVFDINALKEINDTQGHQAGDRFIRRASAIVCNVFKHSPVFRVGGDEFVAVVQGHDYERADELVDMLAQHNELGMETDGVVIACGLARYEGDPNVASVFDRADALMYENKKLLKATS